MKLITEQNFDGIETLIEESTTGKKNYYIHGPMMMGEEENRNGRKYPSRILDFSVEKYVNEMINKNRAFGELNHPNGPTINLERVSHRITELQKDKNDWIGKARIITENPMGAIVRGLIESGGTVGVSSRGLGSLKKEGGCMVVQEDFRIATAADIVHDPSAPRAFVNGIMEGVEYFIDEETGEYKEKIIKETKKKINSLSKLQLQEQQLSLFEDFVANLAVKKSLI